MLNVVLSKSIKIYCRNDNSLHVIWCSCNILCNMCKVLNLLLFWQRSLYCLLNPILPLFFILKLLSASLCLLHTLKCTPEN